jgi:hypothetical protein
LFVVVVVNIGLTIDNRWVEAQHDFPGLRVIWFGIGIVVLFFVLGFNRKSGRLRVQMMTPISQLELAWVRMLAFIYFWLALIFILMLFYFINFNDLPNKSWLTNIISISGIIFLINSIPLLYTDFYSTYFKKSEKALMLMFWGILWIIYIFMNTVFLSYIDFISPEFFMEARLTLTDLYFSKGAVLINVVLGFGLFFMSIETFKRRKLYLE